MLDDRRAIDRLIEYFGGTGYTAIMLGMSKQRINNWKVRRHIPFWYGDQIEQATNGAVTKSEITAEYEERARKRIPGRLGKGKKKPVVATQKRRKPRRRVAL